MKTCGMCAFYRHGRCMEPLWDGAFFAPYVLACGKWEPIPDPAETSKAAPND